MVHSEHGCPGSGPSSGSGGADGGRVTTASGGGDTLSRTAAYSGSSGGSVQTVAIKWGCPGSGPSSGSAAAASSGGDTESPAGGCEFTRARGVRIVPLGTTDIGTTDSADARRGQRRPPPPRTATECRPQTQPHQAARSGQPGVLLIVTWTLRS